MKEFMEKRFQIKSRDQPINIYTFSYNSIYKIRLCGGPDTTWPYWEVYSYGDEGKTLSPHICLYHLTFFICLSLSFTCLYHLIFFISLSLSFTCLNYLTLFIFLFLSFTCLYYITFFHLLIFIFQLPLSHFFSSVSLCLSPAFII